MNYNGCDIGKGISRCHARKVLKTFGDAESIRLYDQRDKRVALVDTPGHIFTALAQDIVYRHNGKLVAAEAGTCIGDEAGIEKEYQILLGWGEWGPREVDANGVMILDDSDDDDSYLGTLEFLFAGDLKDFKA